MCQVVFNPLRCSSALLPSPRLSLPPSVLCFHLQFTATPGSCLPSLPVEFFIMYSFWFGSTAQPSWAKKEETTPRASCSQKSAILIRSAQLLAQVYINTIHCVPSEDSIASSRLSPQQPWAGKWKIFEEEKT